MLYKVVITTARYFCVDAYGKDLRNGITIARNSMCPPAYF